MKRMPVVIPTLHDSLNRLMSLPDDIKLIRDREKIGLYRISPCPWRFKGPALALAKGA